MRYVFHKFTTQHKLSSRVWNNGAEGIPFVKIGGGRGEQGEGDYTKGDAEEEKG